MWKSFTWRKGDRERTYPTWLTVNHLTYPALMVVSIYSLARREGRGSTWRSHSKRTTLKRQHRHRALLANSRRRMLPPIHNNRNNHSRPRQLVTGKTRPPKRLTICNSW